MKLAVVETINLGNSQPKDIGVPAGTSPSIILTNAFTILFVVGALAVLFFLIIGAFRWITSGGDKEAVGNARKTITNALIGLALLSLAGVIIYAVGDIVHLNPFKILSIPGLSSPAGFDVTKQTK